MIVYALTIIQCNLARLQNIKYNVEFFQLYINKQANSNNVNYINSSKNHYIEL